MKEVENPPANSPVAFSEKMYHRFLGPLIRGVSVSAYCAVLSEGGYEDFGQLVTFRRVDPLNSDYPWYLLVHGRSFALKEGDIITLENHPDGDCDDDMYMDEYRSLSPLRLRVVLSQNPKDPVSYYSPKEPRLSNGFEPMLRREISQAVYTGERDSRAQAGAFVSEALLSGIHTVQLPKGRGYRAIRVGDGYAVLRDGLGVGTRCLQHGGSWEEFVDGNFGPDPCLFPSVLDIPQEYRDW